MEKKYENFGQKIKIWARRGQGLEERKGKEENENFWEK